MPNQDLGVGHKSYDPQSFENNTSDTIADVVRAYAGSKSAGAGIQALWDDFQRQKELTEPYDVSSGLGSVTFDMDERKIVQSLSPEAQVIFNRLLSRAEGISGRIDEMSIDPLALQQKIFEEQMGLLRPEHEKLRQRTDERLLAQGIKLATPGFDVTSGLERTLDQGVRAVLSSSLGQSQGILDAERAREAGDVQRAFSMFGGLTGLGDLGRLTGQGGVTQGQQFASMNIADAISAKEASKMGYLSSLFGGGGGGLFGNILGLLG